MRVRWTAGVREGDGGAGLPAGAPAPHPPSCPLSAPVAPPALSPPPAQGKPENMKAGQEALLKRAKANSDAQLGKYDAAGESAAAGERTYEKGYK